MAPTTTELSKRHTTRYKFILILISLLFLAFLALGIWNGLTKVSLQQKMCENQAFSLTALDDSLTAAARLVASNRTGGYDPALREAFFQTYQRVHEGIIARKVELKSDYC